MHCDEMVPNDAGVTPSSWMDTSVDVFDDELPAGGGETSRTTAHLSTALDDGYYRIAQLHWPRALASRRPATPPRSTASRPSRGPTPSTATSGQHRSRRCELIA